ncbi:MAG: S8 family serine peptidase [Pseudomonadota bacterium]
MRNPNSVSRLNFTAMAGTIQVITSSLGDLVEGERAPARRARAKGAPTSMTDRYSSEADIQATIDSSPFMRQRFPDREQRLVRVAPMPVAGVRGMTARPSSSNTITLATCTVIVEGCRVADLAAATNRGARVLHEGLDGKALLQCDTVEQAFGIANLLHQRQVGSATPNFVRLLNRVRPSTATMNWAHDIIGVQGAWKTTRGRADVKIAVLDEGVDASHPALTAALVAQKDFIGGNGNSAAPSGDDAHGTACAGIIVSRDSTKPGVARDCSLIAARIGMGNGNGSWVFDDYATADAVDWAWREGAAVISNSWGGGLPSDAISRAFGRARTQGRSGLGSVVVIAAGNDQSPIDFPGDLAGYITVGASNPKDERKTRTSSDGENFWGSNYGPTMWLLAPGVFITTTDISGPRGYEPGDFTATFNGTSSATPHVAATAALMISANPTLSVSQVREILKATAKPLKGQKGWTAELGWGRLDVAAAVTLSAGPTKSPVAKALSRVKREIVPTKKKKKTAAKRKARNAPRSASRKGR